jgi:diamine N-acetyltransferase
LGYLVHVAVDIPIVKLVEVDVDNWRSVAAVEPEPDQGRFVAPITRYLCLAHYGGEWHPLAIEADGTIVGHVMWAVDPEDGSTWLGGLVIDAAHQRRGIGRAAVRAFLDRFAKDGVVNAALSYQPENSVARRLYLDIGFVETGEMEDDELVARFRADTPRTAVS